jgi:hypothetical protein
MQHDQFADMRVVLHDQDASASTSFGCLGGHGCSAQSIRALAFPGAIIVLSQTCHCGATAFQSIGVWADI